MDILIKSMTVGAIAMISLSTLLVYDFLSICRIMKKEEIVKNIWNKIFRKKHYNETKVFVFIRPIFLQISMLMFILSRGVLSELAIFNVILAFTPIMAFATVRINNRKE